MTQSVQKCTDTVAIWNFSPAIPKINVCTKVAIFTTAFQKWSDRYKKWRQTHPQWQGDWQSYNQYCVLSLGDESGNTPLHNAAKSGNILLSRDIVQLGGKSLLALGNPDGQIPLYAAVEGNQDETVEALIALGSPVNVLPLSEDTLPSGERIPAATPLWYAAQITRNIGMCEILLRHGGIAFPKLDEEGREILKRAANQPNRWEEYVAYRSWALQAYVPVPKVLIQMMVDYLC